jgi:maltooligosyltrehalose trehalohydrolase
LALTGVVDHAMSRCANGVFETVASGVAPGADYLYRLDDERDRPDPTSRFQPHGVHGPSRVVDPLSFVWSDSLWHGAEMADLVIYELHVGTFTPAGTFDAVAERMPYFREIGVTAIELMPVAEFPGGRNWGYDGVHPYAPQSTYGGPDGLRRLVNTAHRCGIAVILDVVYNHLGPEGNYLEEFGPYFTDRYHTPWGKAVNFDGPESDEVRRYFIDNALYWITEFHVDGLRLDAVHAIYDFGARHALEELAEAVHAHATRLGHRALVIAESDLNDPRLVRSRQCGGYGLDGQWSDDFHHAVHAALTGERAGYYVDFGGIEPVVQALRERFVLDGRHSRHRRRRHGAWAADVPAERFVVFLQNHDQVGNRALGERLAALVSFDEQKLAAALLLLSPYVPLLFMGEEYAETHPFLYFVSHGDRELVDAVRRGRRRDCSAFGALAWSGEVPDPQAEETFLRSRLDWSSRSQPGHREILRLYRDLLSIRRAEEALRPGGADARIRSGPDWIGLEALHPRGDLLALFHFSARPAEVSWVSQSKAAWQLRLSTDDERYGGRGGTGERLTPGSDGLRVRLGPVAAALYRREDNA